MILRKSWLKTCIFSKEVIYNSTWNTQVMTTWLNGKKRKKESKENLNRTNLAIKETENGPLSLLSAYTWHMPTKWQRRKALYRGPFSALWVSHPCNWLCKKLLSGNWHSLTNPLQDKVIVTTHFPITRKTVLWKDHPGWVRTF